MVIHQVVEETFLVLVQPGGLTDSQATLSAL